jgi:hypothetical protein
MSYQIRPEDVVILDEHGRPRRQPPGGVSGWIRRHRVLLAGILGIALAFGVAGGGLTSRFGLLVLAIAGAFVYLRVRDRLRPALLREVAWVLVFGLGVGVLLPSVIAITTFALAVVAVLALLILLMLLLGDRHRA